MSNGHFSDNASATSPLALMSLVFGLIGLVFVFMSCFFGPAGMLALLLCPTSIVLGFVELQKIGRGESGEHNRAFATMGAAAGGTGCAVQLIFTMCLFGFLFLYFALGFLLVVGGNM